jgi:hypothetical protein
LPARYHAKKAWPRDTRHLLSRWLRQARSHTPALLLCQWQHLPPLALAALVTVPG